RLYYSVAMNRKTLRKPVPARVGSPTHPSGASGRAGRGVWWRLLTAVPSPYPVLAFVRAKRVVVRGWSMEPTLVPGERVLFDRLAYEVGSPRVGDIVLARHPSRPGMRLIKRVAGVPGDQVGDGGAPK